MDATLQSRVVLLYGGHWSERDISILSAQRVAGALRGTGLQVTPVRWDVDGWVVLADSEPNLRLPGMGRAPIEVLGDLQSDGLGVVFNVLHGGPGEDGTVAGLLDMAGVPYTGAGVLGSAMTFNKQMFRFAAQAFDCSVAPAAFIHREAMEKDLTRTMGDLAVELGFPVIVKPIVGGSSFGVHKVSDPEHLMAALEELFQTERKLIIERFIPGREISISVLGTRVGGPPQVLPPVEIEPLTDTGFFDPSAKYEKGMARETIPAPLEPEVARLLSSKVSLIHRELDLGGMSRTDVILSADGPVFLETNTIPGLTEGSLLPQCAEATGIDFTGLCRRLIDYALSVQLARGSDAPTDAPT